MVSPQVTQISASDRERIRGHADVVRTLLPIDEEFSRYQQYRAGQVESSMPALVIDDFSAIPYIDGVKGASFYQQRSRVRAGTGDIFTGSHPLDPFYEKYNQEQLQLGSPEYLLVEDAEDPFFLTQAILDSENAWQTLCDFVRAHSSFLLRPYMGTQKNWELAERLVENTGTPVKVLTPLPSATRYANDKTFFAEAAKAILGPQSIPETVVCCSRVQVAAALLSIAQNTQKVVIKLRNTASAMGNRVFASKDLLERGPEYRRSVVDEFYGEFSCADDEKIVVMEWVEEVASSPSSQLWVPPLNEGPPRIEGLFEQFLLGKERVFEGSVHANLPQQVLDRLARYSFELALLYQQIGFVGRCSFDAILCGGLDGELKLVECNGRWGGTSIPMSFMNRIFGSHQSVHYKARDYVDERLVGSDFRVLQEIFGSDVYDANTNSGRVIFYNVGCLSADGKFDIITLGETREDAIKYSNEIVPKKIDRFFNQTKRSEQSELAKDSTALWTIFARIFSSKTTRAPKEQ